MTSSNKQHSAPDTKFLERLDFTSTLAEEIVTNLFSKRVLDKALKLRTTPEYQKRLNRNFLTADAPADELAVKMSSTPQVRADYETAIAKGLDAVDAPCKELVAFIEAAENLPDFLDRDMIELGGAVFRKNLNAITFFMYGVPAIAVQAASVGIGAAAVYRERPKGKALALADHQVLGNLSDLMRFMETFKWFNKIAKPGAGSRFGDAFAESCRVRIIHGYVRRAINNNPHDWNYDPPVGWETDKLGVPLSGAEGCVVVTTVAAAIDAARLNNSLNVTDHEIECVYQWANYVSFMQGVPEDMLFGTAEETRVDFSAYMLSVNGSCYKEYTEKFYSGILDVHLETAMFPKSVAIQKLVDGVIRASLYNTYGDKYCDYYGIPVPSKPLQRVFSGMNKMSNGMNAISKKVPFLKKILDNNGEYLWEEVFVKAETYLKEHFNTKSVVSGTNTSHAKDAVT